jgi:chemotaxis response regulator CheB
MPRAAIEATKVDHILTLEQISPFLVKLGSLKTQEGNNS